MKIVPRPNRRMRQSDSTWIGILFCMFVCICFGMMLAGWKPGTAADPMVNINVPVAVPAVVTPTYAPPVHSVAPRTASKPAVKVAAPVAAPACATWSVTDGGPKRTTTYDCHGLVSVVYGK